MSWIQYAIPALCGIIMALRVPFAHGAGRWILALASAVLVSYGVVGMLVPYPPRSLVVLTCAAASLAIAFFVVDLRRRTDQ